MGAWATDSFGNDTAGDWAFGLEGTEDLFDHQFQSHLRTECSIDFIRHNFPSQVAKGRLFLGCYWQAVRSKQATSPEPLPACLAEAPAQTLGKMTTHPKSMRRFKDADGVKPSAVLSNISALLFLAITASAQTLTLHTRIQEHADGTQRKFVTREKVQEWQPQHTAIVVCDMWDQHWCKGATRRVAEMAPRMNAVLAEARQRGVLIIHCPSSCMEAYKDTPMYQLAQQAPKVETAIPLQGWCHVDPKRESPLPIDDSDEGCDCQPRCPVSRPWIRQIATLEIQEGDAITDNAQAFYLMKQRGITNVIVMGVHENMCVLGRPFSIRQMVYQGQKVVLMRDLTDVMYNSRQSPYVSHFDGIRLVTQHIERYWCPTITSQDFTGQPAFKFRGDD